MFTLFIVIVLKIYFTVHLYNYVLFQLYYHSAADSETIFDYIPKEIMPIEIGGSGQTLQNLNGWSIISLVIKIHTAILNCFLYSIRWYIWQSQGNEKMVLRRRKIQSRWTKTSG